METAIEASQEVYEDGGSDTVVLAGFNGEVDATSVSIRDEIIEESYSEAKSAELKDIKLNMNSIDIETDKFIAGLTEEDFLIKANLNEKDYDLKNLKYNAISKRYKSNQHISRSKTNF